MEYCCLCYNSKLMRCVLYYDVAAPYKTTPMINAVVDRTIQTKIVQPWIHLLIRLLIRLLIQLRPRKVPLLATPPVPLQVTLPLTLQVKLLSLRPVKSLLTLLATPPVTLQVALPLTLQVKLLPLWPVKSLLTLLSTLTVRVTLPVTFQLIQILTQHHIQTKIVQPRHQV
jgi:hypothetical protein